MNKIFFSFLFIFIFGCSDSPKMESAADAAYNDAVAECIYRNGNPNYGTREYDRLERMCDPEM